MKTSKFKNALFVILLIHVFVIATIAQTFTSPGQQTCQTTNSVLSPVSAPDGVTITPYRWVTKPCIDENLFVISVNDCWKRPPYNIWYPECNTNGTYLRKPTFCYNNGYFPTTSGYPLAIAENLTANSGNCQYGAAHVVSDFSSVATRPLALQFTINDIDNPYDSIQVLVYSNGALVPYSFVYGDASTSFVKNSLNTLTSGSGTDVSFVSKDWYNAKGWSELSTPDADNSKGVINFTVDPNSYVDSVVIRHIHKDNRPDANPGISIGDFRWTEIKVLPVTFEHLNASIGNDELFVNWNTAGEKENSHFLIEVSKDGKEFKQLKRIETKAENGNSAATLQYSFSVGLNAVAGMFSVFAILALSLTGFRQRKTVIALSILLIASATIYSCAKNNEAATIKNSEKIFVRIAQVDKDGTVRYSKIVQAVVE